MTTEVRDKWQGGHAERCPLSYPEVQATMFPPPCECPKTKEPPKKLTTADVSKFPEPDSEAPF